MKVFPGPGPGYGAGASPAGLAGAFGRVAVQLL